MHRYLKIAIIAAATLYAVSVIERGLATYRQGVKAQRQTEERQQLEIQIKNYENDIFKDSVIISNSPRSYRDSLRAVLNPR